MIKLNLGIIRTKDYNSLKLIQIYSSHNKIMIQVKKKVLIIIFLKDLID
jgi:hypothetical protein